MQQTSMGWRLPTTAAQRAQLLAVVLLSSATFAFGFVSSLPAASPPGESLAEVAPDLAPDAVPATPALGDAGETDVEQGDGRSAVFSCVLQFPFESVLQVWEGGPPDPNFIKEEVRVQTIGTEEHRIKTLYTKNPLPYLIRKTVGTMLPCCQRCRCCPRGASGAGVAGTRLRQGLTEGCTLARAQLIRDEMFIFEEDQRINMQERYSDSSCDNKVLESIVKAHRSSSMRAHPANPDWTIFEQSMSVSISGVLGKTIQKQLESFAESLFLSAAKSGTVTLEQSLTELEAQRCAREESPNGGGVWWTGGSQTVPGATLHDPYPPMPEDSSAGYFSDTLDSWTNWMWPSYESSESSPASASAMPGSPMPCAMPARSKSVWWQDGEEADEWSEMGKSIVIDTGRDEGAGDDALAASSLAAGGAVAAVGMGRGVGRKLAATRQGASRARRGLANMATHVARRAASPAVFLAGVAAQVVTAGGAELKEGMEHKNDAHFRLPRRHAAGTEGKGGQDQAQDAFRPRKLRRSTSHPELDEKELRHSFRQGFLGRQQPLRQACPVEAVGVGGSSASVGAAAAFVTF